MRVRLICQEVKVALGEVDLELANLRVGAGHSEDANVLQIVIISDQATSKYFKD